jgi:putative glutamine amidotransferase
MRLVRAALLVCLIAIAHASAAAPGPVVVEVDGLGPMLLMGDEPKEAARSYAKSLTLRHVYPHAEGRFQRWAAGVQAGPTLAELRASGKRIIGVQLNDANDVLGSAARKVNRRKYARAITEAGGVPLFLPPAAGSEQIEALLGQIDHLLLVGGEDVHPSLYRRPITYARHVNRARDAYDVALVQRAIEKGLGVDGICRGMQVINVATGGTLVQDLHKDGLTERAHRLDRMTPVRHQVRLDPESALARVVGTTSIAVVSVHHEAVDRVGRGMTITGRAPDGVPEVIEGFEGRVRGYQFHPEHSRGRARALFRDMVRRAGRR